MLVTKQIDLGEYVINIKYNDDGSGYLKVSILDELKEEIDSIEVENDENPDNKVNPILN